MPQDSILLSGKASQSKGKHASITRMRSHTESEIQAFPCYKSDGDSESTLTPALRLKLDLIIHTHQWFPTIFFTVTCALCDLH